jgi:hypothetical protein
VTTAARSRDLLRRMGYRAIVVEHRQGPRRVDPFTGDVLAIRPGEIVLVQAYHRDAIKDHAHLVPGENEIVAAWVAAGGLYRHHVWHPPTRLAPWRCTIVQYGGPNHGPHGTVTSSGKPVETPAPRRAGHRGAVGKGDAAASPSCVPSPQPRLN